MDITDDMIRDGAAISHSEALAACHRLLAERDAARRDLGTARDQCEAAHVREDAVTAERDAARAERDAARAAIAKYADWCSRRVVASAATPNEKDILNDARALQSDYHGAAPGNAP